MMEERQPLQQMLLGKLDTVSRKLKLDSCLSCCASINYKWTKDPNIRPKGWYRKKAGNTLEEIGIGKDFLGRTEVARQLRGRIDKWDYMKLKIFCTTKEMVYPQNGRKYLLAIHQTKDR
jgi:hypothetical protein